MNVRVFDLAVAGLLLAGTAVAALAQDSMLYYVADEVVVFTNTPSRADVRLVPGIDPASSPPGMKQPATAFDSQIDRVAREAGLSPSLIKAVASVESAFDARAVSPKGARGLMQLMPATAKQYGVEDPFDPLDNLRAGARHLRNLLDEFGGDLPLALAAYNAGSGAVRRHGGIPAYPETQNYVRKVHEKLGRPVRTAAGAKPLRVRTKPIRLLRQSDGTLLLKN